MSIGRGLTAVATGGLSELPGLLDSGSTSQSQVALLTPEQKAAQARLAQFMNTGKFGDFEAGADAGVKIGDYGMTGLENTGMSELQKLLSSGIPDQFRLGNDALAGILNSDPTNVSAMFDPFKQQVQRQVRDSNTALKRNAGFAGNLYSTNTIRGLGDIEARGNETLTSQLANLTNEAFNRRMQAIPLAYQAGQSQEDLVQGRINSAFNYGSLPRSLSLARTGAENSELLRRRNEMLLPLDAAKTLATNNSQFGVPNVEVQNPNPMLDLLTAVIGAGGQALGARGAG
jgi:hypothetical protein